MTGGYEPNRCPWRASDSYVLLNRRRAASADVRRSATSVGYADGPPHDTTIPYAKPQQKPRRQASGPMPGRVSHLARRLRGGDCCDDSLEAPAASTAGRLCAVSRSKERSQRIAGSRSWYLCHCNFSRLGTNVFAGAISCDLKPITSPEARHHTPARELRAKQELVHRALPRLRASTLRRQHSIPIARQRPCGGLAQRDLLPTGRGEASTR